MSTISTDISARLRELPSVDALLQQLGERYPQVPHALRRDIARQAIADARQQLLSGTAPAAQPLPSSRPSSLPSSLPLTLAEQELQSLLGPSLRPVINATGVVLHTNLGRAPLGDLPLLPGYTNLEYDLAAGHRGKRDAHLAPLLRALLQAPAIAVNNNAAAVYLVLHELAAGGEVLISRGELIEIGDGFRIPEIMKRAGVTLVEVGTTNRTRLEDYEAAITPQTRLILRVHPSNFHLSGFTGRPTLADLVGLGRSRGIPVYEDVGSGCLVDLRPFGIHEPLVQDSLRAGAAVVSFSGDKLLGGCQAGLICGDAALVQRIRRNMMYRAFRLDKLVTQALEHCLRALLLEQYDQLPALRMLRTPVATLQARAEALLAQLPSPLKARLLPGQSLAGGGSTPDQALPTVLLVLAGLDPTAAERQLRLGQPPVLARIQDGELLLDLRTVLPAEEPALLAALQGLVST